MPWLNNQEHGIVQCQQQLSFVKHLEVFGTSKLKAVPSHHTLYFNAFNRLENKVKHIVCLHSIQKYLQFFFIKAQKQL